MSTRIVCDRCGETLRTDGGGYYRIDALHLMDLVQSASTANFDLCPHCLGALKAWLADGKGEGKCRQ